MTDKSQNIAHLLLPEGVLDYFVLYRYSETEKELHFCLEEKNQAPEEYKNDKLISKGFFDEITVQDFPIRGRAVYLHIKRRRWTNQQTGDIVFRNWDMVARGTRMTKEFASFLKAITGYQAGKL